MGSKVTLLRLRGSRIQAGLRMFRGVLRPYWTPSNVMRWCFTVFLQWAGNGASAISCERALTKKRDAVD